MYFPSAIKAKAGPWMAAQMAAWVFIPGLSFGSEVLLEGGRQGLEELVIVFPHGEKKSYLRPSSRELGWGLSFSNGGGSHQAFAQINTEPGRSSERWHARDVSACHMPAEP